MSETRSRDPGGRRAQPLLSRAKALRTVAERVDFHSRSLLGSPYAPDPLGGSPDTPEVLSASLDAFDCVTYVETILALSLSRRAGDVPGWLRRIRYDGGRLEWARRNHYMTGWIRSNVASGVVKRIAGGVRPVLKERTLDTVPDLRRRRARFSCVPKREIGRLEPRLATGDLVFFASTKARLDVFHCGILVREGGRLVMRHASRSQGGVVEQELAGFLKGHRMAGVIVVRPADGPPGESPEERS
jgi:cell wall-associated NlpC family hydrolase